MTSINDQNSAPEFSNIEQAATAWVESDSEYTRLGKLYRAAEKRRKLAGEYLESKLEDQNLIEVNGRRYRFFFKSRSNPSYKDAFNAIHSIVDAAVRTIMDTALENNTSTSQTPALKEEPINVEA